MSVFHATIQANSHERYTLVARVMGQALRRTWVGAAAEVMKRRDPWELLLHADGWQRVHPTPCPACGDHAALCALCDEEAQVMAITAAQTTAFLCDTHAGPYPRSEPVTGGCATCRPRTPLSTGPQGQIEDGETGSRR